MSSVSLSETVIYKGKYEVFASAQSQKYVFTGIHWYAQLQSRQHFQP